jgi:diguanylate cyclase (GGDEF)-like protein
LRRSRKKAHIAHAARSIAVLDAFADIRDALFMSAVVGIVRVMRAVDERNQIEHELLEAVFALERRRAAFEELAMHDELTGLYNRRELDRRLAAETARVHRSQQTFSLVLLDVDHFKSINDRFGHAAGDEVLRRLASIVQSELRISDMAARYGGEEIAIVLPDTSADDAENVAVRLRERLEREMFDVGAGAAIGVTASFGVSCAQGTATTTACMFAAADEALYEAKATGRNRVVSRVTGRRAA